MTKAEKAKKLACKNCKYYFNPSGLKGKGEDWSMCTYCIDTGHRRPCPGGEGCTVKVVEKRQVVHPMEFAR